MKEEFERTAMLIGEEGVDKLSKSRVIVFGVGGVGGYVVEALARAGVGSLDLVDMDVVSVSNINRQIIATHDTIGRPKVEVAKERVLSINPDCDVKIYNMFYLPETAKKVSFASYDYVIDAVDNVTAKISIVEEAKKAGVPIICSMGTGNKLDAGQFEIADIAKTSVCPLAKVMRRELKKRGIDHVKVLYSKALPLKPITKEESASEGHVKQTPGSISFVPSVAGLLIAGEVVRDLLK